MHLPYRRSISIRFSVASCVETPLLIKKPFHGLKNGLIHTGTLGVTQTGTTGVTHTVFVVQEACLLRCAERMKKEKAAMSNDTAAFRSGGGARTLDLRIMNPTL